MMTLQGMMLRTQYMMEQIHRNAVDYTIEEMKKALRAYYENGYDNGESVKWIKEAEKLGVDSDLIFDIDFEIREDVQKGVKNGKVD